MTSTTSSPAALMASPSAATSPVAASSVLGARAVRFVDLARADAMRVDTLTRAAAEDHSSSSAPALLDGLAGLTHHLPLRIIDALRELRQRETSAAVVIRGLPVDEREIGPTPLGWREPPAPQHAPALRTQEISLVLTSALLGEIFGWATLQDGRLVHDVLPMPQQEKIQSGHGTVRLEWHTEDAFHPHRCDYLLLLCLRNPDAVPTTMASIREVALDPQQRAVLAEPRFLLRPDTEHLARAADLARGPDGDHPILRMQRDPAPVSVLFGSPDAPYLRIDPAFMTARPGDSAAAAALDELVSALNQRLVDVPLAPGDLLVIDNYTAVHGRAAYQARFDGGDRWLKKVVVARDLRRSRAARSAVDDRVVCQ